MSATSRELMYQALNFENPYRAPRDHWTLPIASNTYPNELKEISEAFPGDIQGISGHLAQQSPITSGHPYLKGEYVDDWGAKFITIQDGIHGEVKEPLIKEWSSEVPKVHIPREWLTIDMEAVNRDCAATNKFTMAGVCPRPFEQLQFLRGSADLLADLMDPEPEMLAFMQDMHNFYCETLTLWAKTDTDSLQFMDDWGAQSALLISPALWRHYFKPMYRDFAQIAHSAGKKIFMHSDGHILSIYPDLIEIGIDALNSQLFCMGIENLKLFAGKITFWGEIDRQHLLPNGTVNDMDQAVTKVYENLWHNGGCIAQCEFGSGGKPENVRQVYESWDRLTIGDKK